ncbi:hypothetical protein [Commensalibacter sp. Nvir]
MDWFEEFALGDRLKITLWPAFHRSGRGVNYCNHALWGGFVLSTN